MDELNKRVQGTPVEVPNQSEPSNGSPGQPQGVQNPPNPGGEETPPNPFEQHDQRVAEMQGGSTSTAIPEDEEEDTRSFWEKIKETDEELDIFNGSPPFTVRALRDGDTYKVGHMLGKAMGDRRIAIAMQTGDWNTAGMAMVGVVFDTVGRELQLFVADLIGIERDYQDVKMRMQAACLGKDGRQIMTFPTPEEIQKGREDEIISELEMYPPGSSQMVINEIIGRDDFGPFWRSCKLVAKTAGRVFSKLKTN